MNITINKNSWSVWVYRAIWGIPKEKLSNNLCNFFWGWLFSFVLIPIYSLILISCLIFNRKSPELFPATWRILLLFLAIIIEILVFGWTWKMVLFLVALVIGIAVLFSFLFLLRIEKIRLETDSIPSIIYKKITSFKENYCPKINWIEKK